MESIPRYCPYPRSIKKPVPRRPIFLLFVLLALPPWVIQIYMLVDTRPSRVRRVRPRLPVPTMPSI